MSEQQIEAWALQAEESFFGKRDGSLTGDEKAYDEGVQAGFRAAVKLLMPVVIAAKSFYATDTDADRIELGTALQAAGLDGGE